MKKITFLMIAAGIAVSAAAIDKKAEVRQRIDARPVTQAQQYKLQPGVLRQATTLDQLEQRVAKKGPMKVNESFPDGIYPYFRPQNNYMSVGMAEDGNGWSGLGFASLYGELTYYNFTFGADSYKWWYSDFDDIDEEAQWWREQESTDYDFTIKPQVGTCMGPYLEAISGDKNAVYENTAYMLMFGGSAAYYGYSIDEDLPCGLTFYPNAGMKNPEEYSGALTGKYIYQIEKRPQNYTKYGASTQWVTTLQNTIGVGLEVIEKPEGEKNDTISHEVTNVAFNNFVYKFPAPESTYMFSRAWSWMDITASEDAELISYVYKMDEEGNIDEEYPIAVGSAAISSGTTNIAVFNYVKLDEDGDEVEGNIYISGPVAITIEGFAGNPAFSKVAQVSGFASPFNYNAYEMAYEDGILNEFRPTPQLYVNLAFDVDGEPRTLTTYDRGLYYYDQRLIDDKDENSGMVNPDALSPYYYGQFFMNAEFPFIYSMNGEKSLDFELEGGEAEVELAAYFYNIKALIEGYDEELEIGYAFSAPEWVNVEISEPDITQPGAPTTMTVSLDATDTPRSGVISMDGMGATYSLVVNQGESGVATISLEKGAEYYDLMGRKVASPEKGIYIKKHGKTSTKVIF